MYLLIEKIEGPWAVIEWGRESFSIPKFLLPGNAKQGDKIHIEIQLKPNNESIRLRRDKNVSLIYEEVD